MADADVTRDDVETFGMSRAAAWFRVVYGITFVSFGLVTLAIFFQARNVFEIRARSAYLVTLLGLCLLAYQVLLIELNVVVLFDLQSSYFWNHVVLHFLTFTITACYMSRVVRLGVIFDSALRRAVPWLVSEKVLVVVSLSVGLLSLALPLYYRFEPIKGDKEDDFERESSDNFWACIVALQVAKCVMLPGVWVIDDIFNISRELIAIIALGIVQCVISRLAEDRVLGGPVEVWINPPNVGLLASSILFGVSVVDPVRRFLFNPMSEYGHASALLKSSAKEEHKAGASKPPERQRTLWSQWRRVTSSRVFPLDANGSSDEPSPVALRRTLTEDSDGGQEALNGSRHGGRTSWNYESIARVPEVAKAFRDYAHRALCEESVEFLEEVTRYKAGNYQRTAPCDGTQEDAFKTVAKRFIVDGAPEEINISYKQKKAIMSRIGPIADGSMSSYISRDEELSTIFDRAYADIRNMLECNILHKFLETEEFRAAAHRPPAPTVKRRCPCSLV